MNMPGIDFFTCKRCGAKLAFLAQLYAPLDREDAFHREVYVFLCQNTNCAAVGRWDQCCGCGGRGGAGPRRPHVLPSHVCVWLCLPALCCRCCEPWPACRRMHVYCHFMRLS